MDKILSDQDFLECKEALKLVSRSFYLNTMALRHPIKEYVMVSYLICRIADTIEDDPLLAASEKKEGLNIISSLLAEKDIDLTRLTELINQLTATPEELFVIKKHSLVFKSFRKFPIKIKTILQKRINILIDGMIRYTFSEGSKHIKTFKDLDDYCYYVAGVIGELLTEVFSAASEHIDQQRAAELSTYAVSFGLALQYTNIIKDFATDMQRDDFFYPSFLFEKYHIDRYNFLEDRQECRKILHEMIGKAMEHIEKAMHYITLIPKKEISIRIFCLWPLFFAIRTLEEILQAEDQFLQGATIKIRKKTVKKIIAFSSLFSISNRLVNLLYKILVNRVMQRLWNYRFNL